MDRRLLTLLLVLTTLAFPLAACEALPGPPAGLGIGLIYPLTGPQAPGGKEELEGVRVAYELSRQEVPGARSLDLQVTDVQTPDQARAAVDRMIDRGRVPLVIGTYASTMAEVAAAEADRRRTIYWETGAVSDGVTLNHRYVFRTVATGAILGGTAADFTNRVLLPAANLSPASVRAVIVQVSDVYGESVANAEEAGARAAGIQVVDRIRYDPHAFDAAALAAQIGADRPDYLWDVSYLDDGVAIWQQVKRQQVPLRAAVGTSSAFCMPAFGKRLAGDAVGVYAADKPDDEAVNPDLLQPDVRAVLHRAKEVYARRNGGHQMEIPAVAGFVGGWALFHDVLPRIHGSVTPDSIREAALAVDIPRGGTINGGGVRFARPGEPNAGQNLLAPSVVGQWQGVERMRVVYPAGYATAKPIS